MTTRFFWDVLVLTCTDIWLYCIYMGDPRSALAGWTGPCYRTRNPRGLERRFSLGLPYVPSWKKPMYRHPDTTVHGTARTDCRSIDPLAPSQLIGKYIGSLISRVWVTVPMYQLQGNVSDTPCTEHPSPTGDPRRKRLRHRRKATPCERSRSSAPQKDTHVVRHSMSQL